VRLNRPLRPARPPFVAPQGLQLPHSSSSQSLRHAGLVSVMPDGLWANGAKVATLAGALEEPLVRQRLMHELPLLVDQRVSFAALAEVLEAGRAAGRHRFELVVLSPAGEHQVIPIRSAKSPPRAYGDRPELLLTVHINAKGFIISASGGALDPLPLDYAALNSKMKEIKASFPDNGTLCVTAEPQVTTEMLVKTLDAVSRTNDGKLLNDDLIVARQ